VSLAGRTALVTGASRGIGRAIARRLALEGAFVLGTATTPGGAQGIDAELGAGGRGMVLDVTDQASVDALFERIAAEFDPPLVLVNNAGVTRDALALRMKSDDWARVIETNLNSVYRVTSGCLRAMTRARWGRVISISSVVGSMGNPGQTNYAAAKAGMQGYSRALAAELGSRGITVNCVAPGLIETDMTTALQPDQRDALLRQVPVGRFGQPEEVAALVAFLASEQAAYISGETIHINGAMYMG
jgi:3-oxoacyl-[acyl-carrier protein] reductase